MSPRVLAAVELEPNPPLEAIPAHKCAACKINLLIERIIARRSLIETAYLSTVATFTDVQNLLAEDLNDHEAILFFQPIADAGCGRH